MKLSVHKDLLERSRVFRTGCEEVRVKEIMTMRDESLQKVEREWLAVCALWRKERVDCGCVQCLAALKEA